MSEIAAHEREGFFTGNPCGKIGKTASNQGSRHGYRRQETFANSALLATSRIVAGNIHQ